MKLKTISTIFNRSKWLTLYTANNGEQWISNGVAAYSLRGMPRMSPENILRIFDVPEDKHNKWHYEEKEIPTAVSFEDRVRGEIEIEPLKINAEWFGVNYWFFEDEQRVYSFKEDYIKPLLDDPDYLTYHKRITDGGGFVLACKIGLEVKAIIAPCLFIKEMADEIRQIAGLYQPTEREREINAAYELYGTQGEADPPPKVDPESGEIMEEQMGLEERDGE